MSEHKFGVIAWADLTAPNATALRDFYAAVVGWSAREVKMGDYADYTMHAAGGDPVAGVCHAAGSNTGLPQQWLLYVNVPDLDASLAACVARGGRVFRPKVSMGSYGEMAVIQDPAGAVMALVQPATQPRA